MKNFQIIEDWRAPYYGRTPAAPRRSIPSDALLAWRAANEAEAAREQARLAESRAHVRRLAEEDAARRRREDPMWRWASLSPDARAGLRADVERYGRATVEAVLHFTLPVVLDDPAPNQEQ